MLKEKCFLFLLCFVSSTCAFCEFLRSTVTSEARFEICRWRCRGRHFSPQQFSALVSINQHRNFRISSYKVVRPMLPDIANGWYFSDVTSVFSLIAPDPQNTGFAAITAVGLVLGLLGGGGSILALPIFMLAFEHPTDVAMAESLAVVSVGAAVGFVSHLRAGTVDLSVALPFAALAMTGSYFGSQAAVGVPQAVRLALFFMIAVSSSTVMLRSATAPSGMG